jgi:UDP-N-acetylglucosamine--N-acetylmuramyl-(pentapeptide) pyrophosphoryl-undecaprenol N-acetylglucosamine transferase
MIPQSPLPLVAIACGGTGGHLFPGIAVGEELLARGCDVLLLVSTKEVDQEATRSLRDMQVAALPAVGMTGGNRLAFFQTAWDSYRECRGLFSARPPGAVLAMGGFTSAPPVFAGRKCGATTFIHESNAIPGRANRFLAHWVDHAFTGFAETAGRLHHPRVSCTGTPVRPQFQPMDASAARMVFGLDPVQPVLLVMGGSQGASGINELVFAALPALQSAAPGLQILHITGARDWEKAKTLYAGSALKAVARPFLTEMEFALGAATLAVGRSGASSLAELAAMRLPALLIPFPAAVDNHQWHNARAYTESGAARLLTQAETTPEVFVREVAGLLNDHPAREAMQAALAAWERPAAASKIADWILAGSPALKVQPPAPVATGFPVNQQRHSIIV